MSPGGATEPQSGFCRPSGARISWPPFPGVTAARREAPRDLHPALFSAVGCADSSSSAITHSQLPTPHSQLLIGIGNDYRRDDGAGLAVARRVAAAAPPGLVVREATGEGTALLSLWEGADDVILVDAVSSGNGAGTVTCFDAVAAPLPAVFSGCSSHSFGVAEAVELARTLGRLPKRLTVYGIEGGDFGHGVGLTPEVAQAVDALAARLLA